MARFSWLVKTLVHLNEEESILQPWLYCHTSVPPKSWMSFVTLGKFENFIGFSVIIAKYARFWLNLGNMQKYAFALKYAKNMQNMHLHISPSSSEE